MDLTIISEKRINKFNQTIYLIRFIIDDNEKITTLEELQIMYLKEEYIDKLQYEINKFFNQYINYRNDLKSIDCYNINNGLDIYSILFEQYSVIEKAINGKCKYSHTIINSNM